MFIIIRIFKLVKNVVKTEKSCNKTEKIIKNKQIREVSKMGVCKGRVRVEQYSAKTKFPYIRASLVYTTQAIVNLFRIVSPT